MTWKMMKEIFILCVLFLSNGVVADEDSQPFKYTNYRLYEIIPQQSSDLDLLNKLDGTTKGIRFLDGAIGLNRTIEVVVAPDKNAKFQTFLRDHNIQYQIVEDNLENLLKTEILPFKISNVYDWTRYHSLEETYQWLDSLAKNYPDIIKVIKGGKTFEDREIRGVHISHNRSENRGIVIEGGIHAREWISPAFVTYLVNELVSSNDSQVRKIAENYDWYVFPHLNPDGYVYTQTKDRLWRKTRSKNGDCYGTDPNRNWDIHWNTIGSSSQPCSEVYAGKHANSEVEIRSFTNYLKTLKGKINFYISFHSFSQLLLLPYGYTNQRPENYNDLKQIGISAAKALAKRYNTKYTVGQIYTTIYPVSGSSIDWAYSVLKVPIVYTYELRPKSLDSGGFILPPNQIIPTGQETMDSLVALLDEAEKLGYNTKINISK